MRPCALAACVAAFLAGDALFSASAPAQDLSGPDYDVHKAETVHPAPPGQVGRKTTDTETRTGKTDPTRGNERRFRLTMGGFAHRCPSADGFVDGNFEYLLSVGEDRNVGGTIQRSVDFRHFQGRLRGEVGDDARLKEIELRGTYTVTRDRPGEAASGSSKEVGPVKFHPYRGGEPDWAAMRRVVESAADVALGNVILMGGWIYSTAELEWTKPNACVELAFEPPTDTRALGAHATADVKIGLRTKGSPPASAGFRADGIQVLREGSVSPKKAEAKQGEQASVAYTAPAKPRRGDGITLAAVSRAGIAEDKWRIIERARYEGTFTQTMSGRTGSGLGTGTNQDKVTGRLVWTPDDAPKAKPTFGDVPSAFYKVTGGEVTYEFDYHFAGVGNSSCKHHGSKTFPLADAPGNALRYMQLEVAADGRYRMMLGIADRDVWSTWKMDVDATCAFPTGHVTREKIAVNQFGVEIGRQQGTLDADEGFSGKYAARRGVATITGDWSFTKKTD
jgi:hypothetical protein